MMGERSSPFVSGIAVLLICAELLCFSASQTTICTMPSVEEGGHTTLTVEFGFNLQAEEQHRDVMIKCLRETTGETEELLDCYWKMSIKDYRCKVNNPRFSIIDNITEKMTLLLPYASKEDEGEYVIDVNGRDPNSCSFSLVEVNERSDEYGSNWKALDGSSSKDVVIAAIVVPLVLVLVLVLVVAVIWLIKKRRGKRSTRNNGVNSALARLLPCWLREEAKVEEAKVEEAKMPVQATDLGEKKSKDGEEENPEGEDATETVKLHECVNMRV